MTDVIEMIDPVTGDHQSAADRGAVARAGEGAGRQPRGPGGLLGGLTKTVLETALEAEMTEHLGYEKQASSAG